MFGRKLDLLMNLTATSNSSLARGVSLDPSYISRLRRGERVPSKNAQYLEAVASHLARAVSEDYQREVLSGLLRRPVSALGPAERLSEYLHEWLNQEDFPGELRLPEATSQPDMMTETAPQGPRSEVLLSDASRASVMVEHGISGKRRAVLAFLDRVAAHQKPESLLLYSDEALDWLTDDPSFSRRWASLLATVIGRGTRIKIVHTVSRNFAEMLEALERWMPLYMTGSIEPYYYPRKRDGIFGRTLFVAPGIVALTSSSVKGTEDGPTFLTIDPGAVDGLAREISAYLALCRPLMEIFTPRDVWQYLHTLAELEREPADALLAAPYPSLATMPPEVARTMIERSGVLDKSALLDSLRNRQAVFKDHLRTRSFSEIFSVPCMDQVLSSGVRAGFAGLEDVSAFRYHRDELAAHLNNMVETMRRFDGYKVALDRADRAPDRALYVKEGVGAVIVRVRPPNIAFVIRETNLTAALWDYLHARYRSADSKPEDLLRLVGEILETDDEGKDCDPVMEEMSGGRGEGPRH